MSTGYVLDDREIGVQFLIGVRVFSLLHSVQIGSEANQAPCSMGTGTVFPEIKRQ
jgi:hypothetical protein